MARPKNPFQLEEPKDYDNPIAKVDVLNFDHLIGELMNQAEMLGLTDRQHSAYKASLRRLCWDWYNRQFDNPSGLSDISLQARRHHGIDPNITTTSHSGRSFSTHYITGSIG